MLRQPALRTVYGAALPLMMSFVAFYLGLDHHLGAALRAANLSPLAVRAIAVPGFLMPLAVAVLLPRFGAQRMVSVGLATAAAGLAMAAIASSAGGKLATTLAASVLFVAGVGIGVPSLIARTSALAEASWRGQAVSLYTFVLFSGASLGPWLAGTAAALPAARYFGCLALLAAGALMISLPTGRLAAGAAVAPR